jgi:hypothetical protein
VISVAFGPQGIVKRLAMIYMSSHLQFNQYPSFQKARVIRDKRCGPPLIPEGENEITKKPVLPLLFR